MFTRHVIDDLAAYVEQQLDAESRARVEAHLSACERCRAGLEEVRRGIALASELEVEPMPAAAAARVRHTLTDAGEFERASRTSGAWFPDFRIAGVGAAVLVLFVAAWQVKRPWADLRAADHASIAFEREAREIHERLRAGGPMQLRTADEARMRQWMEEHGAPVASIAALRPVHERVRFVPAGISLENVAGARSSVLEYRIDGRPVTLVVAAQGEVAGAPAAGWLSKRVAHRRTPDGRNTLTWSTGGQTYVLVSELEGLGQRACFICHTDARFRDTIEGLTVP